MIVDANLAAPWIATFLGIVAAVGAEQAFRFGNKGSTPDRWRGSDMFYGGFDDNKESNERMERDCAREVAAAYQIVATYCAAGAAVEAAAASQQGWAAAILALIGLLSIAPSAIRAWHAREEIEYLKAWYVHLNWTVARKMVHSQNWDEEDALFAKEHPKEGRVLARRKFDRAAPYEVEE